MMPSLRVPNLSTAMPMKGPPSMEIPANTVRPEDSAVRLHPNSASRGPMKVLSE